MSHTMVIRQKPNVQSTDELWLQQINYLEGLNFTNKKFELGDSTTKCPGLIELVYGNSLLEIPIFGLSKIVKDWGDHISTLEILFSKIAGVPVRMDVYLNVTLW